MYILYIIVTAAIQIPSLQEVILDFLEVHGIREAVRMVQRSGKHTVCIVVTYYRHTIIVTISSNEVIILYNLFIICLITYQNLI